MDGTTVVKRLRWWSQRLAHIKSQPSACAHTTATFPPTCLEHECYRQAGVFLRFLKVNIKNEGASRVHGDDITGCIFYRQPYEVLYGAVKGKHCSKKSLMFLASCSLTCAGNIVRPAEKNDVKEDTTQCACLLLPRWEGWSLWGAVQYFMFLMRISMSSRTLALSLFQAEKDQFCSSTKDLVTQKAPSFLTPKLPQIISSVSCLHVSIGLLFKDFMYVCFTAAMETSKYCHRILFICARVLSSGARGNVGKRNAPRTYFDYHIYWRHSRTKRETQYVIWKNTLKFHKSECYVDKVCASKFYFNGFNAHCQPLFIIIRTQSLQCAVWLHLHFWHLGHAHPVWINKEAALRLISTHRGGT